MYSVLDYGLMAADGVRMSAHARAIEQVVRPGSVVLDLGAGTGIFSLLAARAGARHVHAVDRNPAVWVARDLAAENGFADRISVYEVSSFDLKLPEQVDVILSDMRGKTGLNGDHLMAVRDARSRWLKPGGVAIPLRDRLFVGVVQGEHVARELACGWESLSRFGFQVDAARTSILNSLQDDRRRSLAASELVSTAASWASIEYGAAERETFQGAVTLEGTRRGIAAGLAIWFEATLLEGITYASAPGQELAYARGFLPLAAPVAVAEGDRIELSIGADARGERWSWETKIESPLGKEKARFRQSSFYGLPTSPAALLRSSNRARPRLSEAGERVRRVLDAMDGSRTAGEIADAMAKDLPSDDAQRAKIIEEVRDTIQRFGRS